MRFIIDVNTSVFSDTDPNVVIDMARIKKISEDLNRCMAHFEGFPESTIQELTATIKDMKIDTLEKLKYYLLFSTIDQPDCTLGALLIIIATSLFPIFEKIETDHFVFKTACGNGIVKVWHLLEGDGGGDNFRRWKKMDNFIYMFIFFDIPPSHVFTGTLPNDSMLNYAFRFNRFAYITDFFKYENTFDYIKPILQHDNLDIYKLHKCTMFNPKIPFSYEFAEPQIEESPYGTTLTGWINNDFPKPIIGFQLTPRSCNIALFEFSKLDLKDKTNCLDKLFYFKYYEIIDYLFSNTPIGPERIWFFSNIQCIVNNYCDQIKTKMTIDNCTDSTNKCDKETCPVIFACLIKYLYLYPSITNEQQLLICMYFDLEEHFDKLIIHSSVQTAQKLLVWNLACTNIDYVDRIMHYIKINFPTEKISFDKAQCEFIGSQLSKTSTYLLNSLKKLLENDIIDGYQVFHIFLNSKTSWSYKSFQAFFSSKWYLNDVQLLLKTIESNNEFMFEIFKQNPAIIIENFDTIQEILKIPHESTKIDRHCFALMR